MGKQILTGSEAGWAILWDIETGTRIGTILEESAHSPYMAISSDGTKAVTARSEPGEEEGTALCDLATDRLIGVLSRHANPVNCAAFSSGGAKVVTGSNAGTVRIWQI